MAQADPIPPVKTSYAAPAATELDDDFYDDDEPTSEELIEMLRESLRDVEEGRTRPFDELLCRLNAIVGDNGTED